MASARGVQPLATLLYVLTEGLTPCRAMFMALSAEDGKPHPLDAVNTLLFTDWERRTTQRFWGGSRQDDRRWGECLLVIRRPAPPLPAAVATGDSLGVIAAMVAARLAYPPARSPRASLGGAFGGVRGGVVTVPRGAGQLDCKLD